MPLKIVKARSAKTKNLYIRGAYLGVPVDKSCRTDRRSVATRMLRDLERAIEQGEYPPREAPPNSGQPTFMSAAVAYMEAGGSPRFVARLIKHFGDAPLGDIDQTAVDNAAAALYPLTTGATRNRCVYTPVSAILRHAGGALMLRRPKGAKGRVVTDWLVKQDALGIIKAAEAFDREKHGERHDRAR